MFENQSKSHKERNIYFLRSQYSRLNTFVVVSQIGHIGHNGHNRSIGHNNHIGHTVGKSQIVSKNSIYKNDS